LWGITILKEKCQQALSFGAKRLHDQSLYDGMDQGCLELKTSLPCQQPQDAWFRSL
jgi:hypothetical protein